MNQDSHADSADSCPTCCWQRHLCGSLLDLPKNIACSACSPAEQRRLRLFAASRNRASAPAAALVAVRRIESTLGTQAVELVTEQLQEYDSGGEEFDILLLRGCINHLDEQACIKLHHDPDAQQTYRELFEKLAGLSKPGGVLVVTDCSRENLFARLGIKNPIATNIEWHKHQKPELWAQMLEQTGFAHPRIRWASFNTLRSPGRLLLGNRIAAYCLTSTFRLTMERASGKSAPPVAQAFGARR